MGRSVTSINTLSIPSRACDISSGVSRVSPTNRATSVAAECHGYRVCAADLLLLALLLDFGWLVLLDFRRLEPWRDGDLRREKLRKSQPSDSPMTIR
jgi:hypothetical protein